MEQALSDDVNQLSALASAGRGSAIRTGTGASRPDLKRIDPMRTDLNETLAEGFEAAPPRAGERRILAARRDRLQRALSIIHAPQGALESPQIRGSRAVGRRRNA